MLLNASRTFRGVYSGIKADPIKLGINHGIQPGKFLFTMQLSLRFFNIGIELKNESDG